MYYVCKLSLTSQFGNKACCCCCSVVQKIPEYMQFGFRFKILLFSTSVRFSTKTLAYLTYKAFIACEAYKAFMAFKRSRLSPFQKYRSVTSFRMDCPRTIRLVCVCKYFERLHHKAPGNRKPKTLHLHRQINNPKTNKKWLKEVVKDDRGIFFGITF